MAAINIFHLSRARFLLVRKSCCIQNAPQQTPFDCRLSAWPPTAPCPAGCGQRKRRRRPQSLQAARCSLQRGKHGSDSDRPPESGSKNVLSPIITLGNIYHQQTQLVTTTPTLKPIFHLAGPDQTGQPRQHLRVTIVYKTDWPPRNHKSTCPLRRLILGLPSSLSVNCYHHRSATTTTLGLNLDELPPSPHLNHSLSS